jgi:hypothetical protein
MLHQMEAQMRLGSALEAALVCMLLHQLLLGRAAVRSARHAAAAGPPVTL